MKTKKKDENYDSLASEFIYESEDDEFSIGQCYDSDPAKRLECTKCGSKQFVVGQGSYYTAIKCPNCKWEYCIHAG